MQITKTKPLKNHLGIESDLLLIEKALEFKKESSTLLDIAYTAGVLRHGSFPIQFVQSVLKFLNEVKEPGIDLGFIIFSQS